MKIAAFEQMKKSLQRAKSYTTNKISEFANATVAAIEEIENNKANAEHKHSAGDITSGTLPIANGGTGNTTGLAASATKLATARTIRTNLASTSSVNFDGTANVTPGVTGTLPIANGGTGNTTGLAASATKLATARTIRTNLASTSSVNFDGTANVTPGVTGTLPIANGGTGNTTGLAASATKLVNARTLALSGDVTGSASFDGSADKTITATLANSGVTAGTYGALELVTKNNGTVWVSNNVGLHGTSAISTWKAKQACKISFRWRVSSESASYDYLNITAADTQILANTGGTAEQTGTLTVTLAAKKTIVFTYRKDGSANNGMDRAEISEIKYGAGTADPSTVIYENNVEDYFEITNNNYGFYPAIPIPSVTVDVKGRITAGKTIYVPFIFHKRHDNGTLKEGVNTTASGTNAHAEGISTTASGDYSHAEGNQTTASSYASHAEGYYTKASGIMASHAEGYSTTASGRNSHAEGSNTKASNDDAHAEGNQTTASSYASHAEGSNTIASGYQSHAGGYCTKASGNYQTAIGIYNKESTAETDKFIIGNGTSDTARSNCLRVTNTNGVYSNSTYKSSGADYAETFEWLDGNPKNEDRTGLFVTLKGDKIQIATSEDDYILGVISACPSVCGDVCDDTWKNMYLLDIFGRFIMEEVEIPEKTEERITINENGEEVTETVVIEPAHTEIRPKLNPEYDTTQQYIPRSERSEWDSVGILGKLVAIDDGSCKENGWCKVGENGWCKVGENGIATKSESVTKYRVMKRLDKNHIKLLIA